MGRHGQSRHTALGPLPCVETAGEAVEEAGFLVQKLGPEAGHLHAVEGVLSRARPPRADDKRCELRGVLLYLLQPGERDRGWDILPRQEREVSCWKFEEHCDRNANVDRRYQQLVLKHVPDNGCMGAYEFT